MQRLRLERDEIVTLETLTNRGLPNTEVAALLSITEGAVRYRKKRLQNPSPDRRAKPSLIERTNLAPVVEHWYQLQREQVGPDRRVNATVLWDHLREEHRYQGSEKSVRKYLRQHFPLPRLRTYRRVETPPGAQAQTDWVEYPNFDVGQPGGAAKVYALIMTLSHSRKRAVVWSTSCDQVAWHHCHNEAFRRLGGVPAVNRIDNCKTGISLGAGAWGEINGLYRRYARVMGFHVDACAPYQPQQKGKVERSGRVLRSLGVERGHWETLATLQASTDERMGALEQRRLCPVTGETIHEAWERERKLLRPLPATLPAPFDLVKEALVAKDALIWFENHQYGVPFRYAGQIVEARGCSEVVQIVDTTSGAVLIEYPRHTAERLLIDPSCYEGSSTDRVMAPTPLGRMAKRLAELGAEQVERRSVEIYALLAEVAR